MSEAPCLVVDLPDEAATARLGAALAAVLAPGDVVALDGDLGAGKTALVRALVRAATGQPDEEVPSPTFTLVQTYDGANGATYWHFDLYRLESPDDAVELDIDEAFSGGIALVEWPDRLGGWLPRRALRIALTIPDGTTRRRAALSGGGTLPARIRAALEALPE
ncbi:tRNA (adenosine(37)-N6)-threonylcarbamoyltransferase complex ATPase subunit type 1 TsaE [Novispirillum sp. DQ9]|uniref:tRNA (adenosine(37)-N6)-threonylcarbamoyltransferase complex ATPase subunit type 1 TsaE n=1 Tax=Novispirillum sp. DQ9 TaxID=3398612 RepID=UPI003C7AA0DB